MRRSQGFLGSLLIDLEISKHNDRFLILELALSSLGWWRYLLFKELLQIALSMPAGKRLLGYGRY